MQAQFYSEGTSIVKAKEARMKAVYGEKIRNIRNTLRYGHSGMSPLKSSQGCVTNIGTSDDPHAIRSVDKKTVIVGDTMVICDR